MKSLTLLAGFCGWGVAEIGDVPAEVYLEDRGPAQAYWPDFSEKKKKKNSCCSNRAVML